MIIYNVCLTAMLVGAILFCKRVTGSSGYLGSPAAGQLTQLSGGFVFNGK